MQERQPARSIGVAAGGGAAKGRTCKRLRPGGNLRPLRRRRCRAQGETDEPARTPESQGEQHCRLRCVRARQYHDPVLRHRSAYLDYMIDDAPAKLGLYTPGSHFLIQPRSILDRAPRPDYLLLLAWSFFGEIAKKCSNYLDGGGRMIVPLPNVQIMMHPGRE
ncbi:MAG: hypothetical protein D4R74_05675 [Betaproteobacteria bacterium]|nr:MAG: hypothetical protein D4R74_05675 [Betaproteobacteria bacterium]